ncbi:TPA: hypothetical protein ACH3X1_016304 [Trebouxia sp. C0004]
MGRLRVALEASRQGLNRSCSHDHGAAARTIKGMEQLDKSIVAVVPRSANHPAFSIHFGFVPN